MITTIALLAEIGDFKRFKDPDQYCSFLGLMPWECSSGEMYRTKGIQPRCNHYLRSMIIEASWSAIRKAPNLLQYYRKHAIKNSKHAIVKVARKLALIVRSVIINHQYYDPGWTIKGPSMPISN
jgi:transposase